MLLIVVAIAAWLSGRMPPVPRSVRSLAGCWGGDFINSILERSSDSTPGATATLVGVVAIYGFSLLAGTVDFH